MFPAAGTYLAETDPGKGCGILTLRLVIPDFVHMVVDLCPYVIAGIL